MRYHNMRYMVRKGIRLGLLKNRGGGKHVLVACFPKSGSTYLTRIIAELTGYTRIMLVQPSAPHNEQDIYDMALSEVAAMNTVSHQHVKGTERNLELIKRYNLKPIVLTRNLYDIVMSAMDHIESEDHRTPIVYVHKEYFQMSTEEKQMFLIRNMLPWYFSFLISWQEASRELDVYWTTYEELFGDQVKVLTEVAEFAGFQTTPAAIEETRERMKQVKTRKNVGKSGRGEALTDAHKEAVLEIARSWKVEPEVMRRIGLTL